MRERLVKQIAASALSLVFLTAAGCAGPMRPGAPGGGAGAGGGAATPGASNPQGAATTPPAAGTAPGMNAPGDPGVSPAPLTPRTGAMNRPPADVPHHYSGLSTDRIPTADDVRRGFTASVVPPARGDLGRQISRYVAGLPLVSGAPDLRASADQEVGVTTLLVGNLAFVGIDPTTISTHGGKGWITMPGTVGASLSGDPRGSAGTGLEGYLRHQLRTQFPGLREVYVTTDPDMVRRIVRAADGMGGGTAGASAAEVQAIMRALAPATAGNGR